MLFGEAEKEEEGNTYRYTEKVYTRGEQSIAVTGLPTGVKANYENEKLTEVGETTATATFYIEENSDLYKNYDKVSPATMSAKLIITKAQLNNTDYTVTLTQGDSEVSANTYAYNGEAKTPTVVLKDKNNNTLAEGTDFTVGYTGNIGADEQGTIPTVTITGMGNYDAESNIVEHFVIKKAETSLESKVISTSEKISEAERINKVESSETNLTIQNILTPAVNEEVEGTYTYELVDSDGNEKDIGILSIDEEGKVTLNNKVGRQYIKTTFTTNNPNFAGTSTIFALQVIDKTAPTFELSGVENITLELDET